MRCRIDCNRTSPTRQNHARHATAISRVWALADQTDPSTPAVGTTALPQMANSTPLAASLPHTRHRDAIASCRRGERPRCPTQLAAAAARARQYHGTAASRAAATACAAAAAAPAPLARAASANITGAKQPNFPPRARARVACVHAACFAAHRRRLAARAPLLHARNARSPPPLRPASLGALTGLIIRTGAISAQRPVRPSPEPSEPPEPPRFRLAG